MERITAPLLRNYIYNTAQELSATGKKVIVVKNKIITDMFTGFDTRKLASIDSISFKNCVFMLSVNLHRFPRNITISIVNCTFSHSLSLMGLSSTASFHIESISVGNVFEVRYFEMLTFQDVNANKIIIYNRHTPHRNIGLSIGKFCSNSISIEIEPYNPCNKAMIPFAISECHESSLGLISRMLPSFPILRVYADKEQTLRTAY